MGFKNEKFLKALFKKLQIDENLALQMNSLKHHDVKLIKQLSKKLLETEK